MSKFGKVLSFSCAITADTSRILRNFQLRERLRYFVTCTAALKVETTKCRKQGKLVRTTGSKYGITQF